MSNDTLYVGSQGGLLYALDTVSGDRQWTFVADGLVQTTPLVSDEGIFVRAGTTLYGLDTALRANDTDEDTEHDGSRETPDSVPETVRTPQSTDRGPETDSTPTERTDDDVATTGDDGSGFGILAVGVSLVLVALLVVSRLRE